MYDDDTEKDIRDRKMSLFLRVTVPALLEGPAPSVQVEPELLVLTEAELEAVQKARADFLEHDR